MRGGGLKPSRGPRLRWCRRLCRRRCVPPRRPCGPVLLRDRGPMASLQPHRSSVEPPWLGESSEGRGEVGIVARRSGGLSPQTKTMGLLSSPVKKTIAAMQQQQCSSSNAAAEVELALILISILALLRPLILLPPTTSTSVTTTSVTTTLADGCLLRKAR
jgi:hypothetical protein